MTIHGITVMSCEDMLATVSGSESGVWISLRSPHEPPWDAPLTLHFKGAGAYEKAVRVAAAINDAPAIAIAAE